MKGIFTLVVFLFVVGSLMAQSTKDPRANRWVDSVFKTLTKDEKIGQLMVVRLSSIDGNRKVTFYEKEVKAAIQQYNIGAICLFQGGPLKQAAIINNMQRIAKTP